MRDWAMAGTFVVAMCAAMIAIVVDPRLAPTWVGLVAVSDAAMGPTFEQGDVLVVVRQDAYEHGEVVAYESIDGAQQVARVVSGGPRTGYVVAGDDQGLLSGALVAHEGVLGRVSREVPTSLAAVSRVVVASPVLVLLAAIGVAVTAWSPAHLRRRRADVERRRRIRVRQREAIVSDGPAAPAARGRGTAEGGTARPASTQWTGSRAGPSPSNVGARPWSASNRRDEVVPTNSGAALGRVSGGRRPARRDGLASLDSFAPDGEAAETVRGLAGLDHLAPDDLGRPTPLLVFRAADAASVAAGAARPTDDGVAGEDPSDDA